MTIISVSNLYFTSEEIRGIIMKINVLLRIFVSLPLLVIAINAQDGVDAIEKARQAKEAADKAAAEAAAATEAAIEAAAAKAARAAREDAKKKKEEDEARKIAEAKAAEEAELDAAASAAAEAAKRKMAEELGLEVSVQNPETTVAGEDEQLVEEVTAKESSSFSIGLAPSIGVLNGESFTTAPVGVTMVLTTPLGFKLGPFDYTVSLAFGNYSGQYDTKAAGEDLLEEYHTVDEISSPVAAIGGNLTLADFIFAEGHVGVVGAGSGFRGYAGITLEKLMSENLPFNILLGSELFISNQLTESGNQSGWVSLGLRLDYSF